MNKPTIKQFFIGYAIVFVVVQVFVWYCIPTQYPFLTASIVNLVFVAINLLGAVVGLLFEVWPWQDVWD